MADNSLGPYFIWLDLLGGYQQDSAVTLCAFDLLEVNIICLRVKPIFPRKNTLAGRLGTCQNAPRRRNYVAPNNQWCAAKGEPWRFIDC